MDCIILPKADFIQTIKVTGCTCTSDSCHVENCIPLYLFIHIDHELNLFHLSLYSFILW